MYEQLNKVIKMVNETTLSTTYIFGAMRKEYDPIRKRQYKALFEEMFTFFVLC